MLGCFRRLVVSGAVLVFACGDDGKGKGGGGDAGAVDASVDTLDAFYRICLADAPQCDDCMDNDADGYVDGFDPECSGPLDRLEDSFASGIPGDNMDATNQDCFFDGNSDSNDDGCIQHVCCLLQAVDQQECALLAPDADSTQFNQQDCYQPFGPVATPQSCIDSCGTLTPAGCDCFGCCTVCNASGCRDIVLNPAASPNCSDANITLNGVDGIEGTGDDPCQRCVKNMNCGSTACASDGVTCTPCLGQCNSEGTCDPPMPSSCAGQITCPSGQPLCDTANNYACPTPAYCSSGCCIGDITL